MVGGGLTSEMDGSGEMPSETSLIDDFEIPEADSEEEKNDYSESSNG